MEFGEQHQLQDETSSNIRNLLSQHRIRRRTKRKTSTIWPWRKPHGSGGAEPPVAERSVASDKFTWSVHHVIRHLVPVEWSLLECATASKEASRRLHKAQLRVIKEPSLNLSSHARRSKQRKCTRTEQTKGEGRSMNGSLGIWEIPTSQETPKMSAALKHSSEIFSASTRIPLSVCLTARLPSFSSPILRIVETTCCPLLWRLARSW